MRVLTPEDAALLVEATSRETASSVWGPRPAGPYTLADAKTALAAWAPEGDIQLSTGIFDGEVLIGAVGISPDSEDSVELAYWVRPERRRQGVATRAVHATTLWAHRARGAERIWLEIEPDNEPSLRLAQRVGYQFEETLPGHCRDWATDDIEQDGWHDCMIWAHLGV
jgi:RimJ/RimL family protein N-acetyltransferase